MYTCITDFLCCIAETNIVKKLYFNKNKNFKNDNTSNIFNLASHDTYEQSWCEVMEGLCNLLRHQCDCETRLPTMPKRNFKLG